MNKQLATIEGRVLDPPKVQYKDKSNVRPVNGAWDMRKDKFFNGVTVDKWAIVVFPRNFREDDLR